MSISNTISIAVLDPCQLQWLNFAAERARSAARLEINDWLYHWILQRGTGYVGIAVLDPLQDSMIESIIESCTVEYGLYVDLLAGLWCLQCCGPTRLVTMPTELLLVLEVVVGACALTKLTQLTKLRVNDYGKFACNVHHLCSPIFICTRNFYYIQLLMLLLATHFHCIFTSYNSEKVHLLLQSYCIVQ
jgi:hypothetical protein